MNFHDFALVRRSREKRSELDLATLYATDHSYTDHTNGCHSASVCRNSWLAFDAANNDDLARRQAQFLVWDGVSHPFSASFEKVDIVDKNWPFYLFHVVITSPDAGVARDRSS